MPGRNGTGPIGTGAMTGRGMGNCTTNNAMKYGVGLGCAAGMGYGMYKNRSRRRFPMPNDVAVNSEDALLEEKSILEERLKRVNNELEKDS